MERIHLGDIVSRISYGGDILFKVVGMKSFRNGKVLKLKGISYRIEADAPECDVEVQSEMRVDEYLRGVSEIVDNRLSEIKNSEA